MRDIGAKHYPREAIIIENTKLYKKKVEIEEYNATKRRGMQPGEGKDGEDGGVGEDTEVGKASSAAMQ